MTRAPVHMHHRDTARGVASAEAQRDGHRAVLSLRITAVAGAQAATAAERVRLARQFHERILPLLADLLQAAGLDDAIQSTAVDGFPVEHTVCSRSPLPDPTDD